MEFSQYVLDAIATIDYRVDDYGNCKSLDSVRNASKNATNEIDSHILEVIAGAPTMSYNAERRAFVPFLVWHDGRRSFAPEDLAEGDIDILCSAIQATTSPYFRTKVSHIVWSFTKNNRYGEIAVKGYIDEFQKCYDPDNWVKCYEQILAAYHISSVMGSKSESFKQVYTSINQALTKMEGLDPLFLSLNLLGLILKDAPDKDLPMYESIMDKLVDKNLHSTNRNTTLADSTYATLEKLYRRMKKEKELKFVKKKYAQYYEAQASALAQGNDYFRAVIMLKRACSLYAGIDQEKQLELRAVLVDWQEKSLQEMHTQAIEIDLKPINDAVAQIFEGLTLTEAIIQFGRVAPVYCIEDVKKELFDNPEKKFFSSLFSSSLLNEQGQTVQTLPSIRETIESGDSAAMKKHMVRYVSERRRLQDSFQVGVAYRLLRRYGTITEDDLDFLVRDNVIIPPNRAEIIRQGLCMGLNGKLYAAMHILQPQMENIIRHLVRLCGDTVTFLKEDGSEAFKPLSSLFKSEKLRECYDENLIFTFQSIMDESAGENLRNLTGHGLLEPNIGNSVASVHFMSLVVLFLSLYGAHARPVRIALAKREQEAADTDEKGE